MSNVACIDFGFPFGENKRPQFLLDFSILEFQARMWCFVSLNGNPVINLKRLQLSQILIVPSLCRMWILIRVSKTVLLKTYVARRRRRRVGLALTRKSVRGTWLSLPSTVVL